MTDPWMFLDPYDSHLDARCDRNGLTVDCLHEDGFQYLWKGIRGNYGVTEGVFMFEVKVLENLNVLMPETEPQNQNILRCGFSQPLTSLFLGDSAEGWGWGGTGKKSHNNEYVDYGGPFHAGDVIGCVIDMEQSTISFTKNGQFMGVAFGNLPPIASETGMFPHLLMKNVKCQVNFRRETKWFDPPGPQVKFFEEAAEDMFVPNPVEHPASVKQAEFVMLCGLPACGKTYWAQKHMEANPTKSFVLLGTNAVIDQMRVMNLNRQRNYGDRWEELISQATPIFNKLVAIAGRVPRNIILDQTNVYKNARRRKAAVFQNFGARRCVTIVNDEATLAQRTVKREREEGKFVPLGAVGQMRANFVAPELEDGFTAIDWPDIPQKDAQQRINEIRSQGMNWIHSNPNAGNGSKPKSYLQFRTPNQIGRDSIYDKGKMEEERQRSRTPMGRQFGFGQNRGIRVNSCYVPVP